MKISDDFINLLTLSDISLAEFTLYRFIDLSAFNETGPLTKLTDAPSSIAASARAYPIFPELLLDINLTGSICSLVGPAVIVITFPLKGPVLVDDAIKFKILSGSTILPGPTSPHACSPSAGPINEIPLDEIFL